jgi:uncharacterized protein YjiK
VATVGRIAALCALVVSLLLTAAAVTFRCGTVAADEPWLPRYDLRAGSRRALALPAALAEVSGLAVDGRGRLLAHQDEQPTLYVLDPDNAAIVQTIRVGPGEMRGDFEGVAVAGDRIFLVTSGGTLLEVVESPAGEAASSRSVTTGLDKICEVEGLAYDAASAALLLPCKTTWGKQLDDRLVVYAVPLATLALDPRPRIDVAHSDLKGAGLQRGFHPSAIEVHPRSGTLFLVAGREAAIVEISADGKTVLAARQLSRNAHPQPEGLAFGPGLELWIADEGGRGGGTLTSYPLAPAAAGMEN